MVPPLRDLFFYLGDNLNKAYFYGIENELYANVTHNIKLFMKNYLKSAISYFEDRNDISDVMLSLIEKMQKIIEEFDTHNIHNFATVTVFIFECIFCEEKLNIRIRDELFNRFMGVFANEVNFGYLGLKLQL